MDDRETARNNHSFVVRIWREGSGWRAWVQHARSGETNCVQDIASLLAFIERWLGKLSPPDKPPARLR